MRRARCSPIVKHLQFAFGEVLKADGHAVFTALSHLDANFLDQIADVGILLRYRREEAWATLVSFLGLPADPTWADHILGTVEGKRRIEEIEGIGCQPVLISATTEEMLEWIGDGLRSRALAFPEGNGAVIWPLYSLEAALKPRQGVA
jgi:hypothetical protein